MMHIETNYYTMLIENISRLSNGTSFDDLESPLTQNSRSHIWSQIYQNNADRATVTIL